ncbi:MAG: hypothetical protein JW784_00005, partial [Candidatus Cloacimonetes bacterium]|nr:hypothetical protein [Candidatus Cloacimonadota bacterium]
DSVIISVILDMILPPTNLNITIAGGQVRLEWDPVPEATGYLIYSSDEPYAGFELDETGEFEIEGTVWTCPFLAERRFYRVVAIK